MYVRYLDYTLRFKISCFRLAGISKGAIKCLDGIFLCCPFPHVMLDEILDLIESVSEGFPTYS